MDPWPYSYSRQGSQAYENVPSKGAQLLVYPSLANPPSAPLVTQHKRVKLSTRFKRLLVVAAALPLLALILVICSTLSPQWERLEFLFDRLIQRACLRQTKTTWRLAHVVLEGGGSRVTRFDNHTRWEICHRWKETPPTIVGVGIYPGCAQNATLIEVFNVLGGAFQVCNEKQAERGLMAFVRSSLGGGNTTCCFNYITNGSRWKGSGCRLMMLRMQNNLIACTIIVFLCIIASIVIGAISVLARMVPAALVNAFLYLTACVFIIFANCIEHIKVNHIQSKWGPCYPIVSLPPDLYDPTLIRVQYGWSVYVNWIVVGVFVASASVWFVLKQFLYVETAKAMI
ncbi:hypothetical protein TcWFU_006070 [Taenia crassiceps]|uniref:Uncharacterized protein n=1 Tax=Taenia crassiceps TaxID=6207 RepID=A0ABR4QAZ2_9CEST